MTNSNPRVESISLPREGIYGGANQLIFSLQFNENVFASGAAPRLPVEVGYRKRYAEYLNGSGTDKLDFFLNATPGDLDSDGISLGVVDPVTGIRDFDFASSITDALGNPVSEMIPAINTKNILIDAKGPEVIGHGHLIV